MTARRIWLVERRHRETNGRQWTYRGRDYPVATPRKDTLNWRRIQVHAQVVKKCT